MGKKNSRLAPLGNKYEVIFSIFLIALAFLYRENEHLVYPTVLYMLLLFLFLNLTVGLILRLWPTKEWLTALVTTANCGVITAIISYSGGPNSNLWVLYLLPIYSVCLLLKGREVIWITAGVISFNVGHYFHSILGLTFDAASFFDMGIRAGLFIFAAAAIRKIALRNRLAQERINSQRESMQELMSSVKDQKKQSDRLQKMADVGQLTSGVVHDLNNPITVMFGTVKLLMEELNSYPHIKPDLERLLRSAQLCRTILGNLLTFARNQSSEHKHCHMHDIVQDSVSLYGNTLVQNGISVKLDLAKSLPPIQGSASQLQRIFLNLMANAKNVLPKGKEIIFRTEHVVPAPGVASEWVRVTVEDNGPGFPKTVLENMFRPFNSKRENNEGTGLGLYLAKEIISQHKGRIQAQNKPNGGAQFIITLPADVGSSKVQPAA